MEYTRYKRMMKLHKRLMDVLDKAIDRDGDRNFNYELGAVLLAANEWAVQYDDENLFMVSAHDVANADQRAAGHVDWFRKLCLYIAEAVYSEENHETSD